MNAGYVYIITSQINGTIYVWVTNNLIRRIEEHKSWNIEWFTKKYNCKILVYYEYFEKIETAILREKQVKKYSRAKKLKLIEDFNPEWRDLFEKIKELV